MAIKLLRRRRILLRRARKVHQKQLPLHSIPPLHTDNANNANNADFTKPSWAPIVIEETQQQLQPQAHPQSQPQPVIVIKAPVVNIKKVRVVRKINRKLPRHRRPLRRPVRKQPMRKKPVRKQPMRRNRRRLPIRGRRRPANYGIAQGQLRRMARRWGHRGMSLPPRPTVEAGINQTWQEDLPVYVITINDSRYNGFAQRSNAIKHMVHKWNGTNGHKLNKQKWARKAARRLKRGQIGCYDSHVRVWKHMVNNNIEHALICEDDATITGREAATMRSSLEELKNTHWDIAFMSWFRPYGRQPAAHSKTFKKQWTFCQLFAYIMTKRAAQKILRRREASYYAEPVDVMLHTLHQRGVLHNVVKFPPVSLPVSARSDTNGIK